jgi:hypothetical protein
MKIPLFAFLIALLGLSLWAAPGPDPYACPIREQDDPTDAFAPLLTNVNIQVRGELLGGESTVPIGPVSLVGVGPNWTYEENSPSGDMRTTAYFRYMRGGDGTVILYCSLLAQRPGKDEDNTTISFSGPVVFSLDKPIQVTKQRGGTLTVSMSQVASPGQQRPEESELPAGKVLEPSKNGQGVLLDHNVSLDLTGAFSGSAGDPKQPFSIVFVGAGREFPVTLYDDAQDLTCYGTVTVEGLQAGKYSVDYNLCVTTGDGNFPKTLLRVTGTVLCQPGVPVELLDNRLASMTLTLDRVISAPDED